MRCISCTSEIAEDSLSCPSCGAMVEDSADDSQKAADSSDAKTRILPETSKPRPEGDSAASGRTSTHSDRSGVSSDSLDRARFVSGTIIGGQYRIVGLLGRGGMGEVYRAEDLKLEQPVALKFLPESLAKDGAALARFHREVRIARQISHRNVCRVYNIIEYQGWHFILMEFVRGEELSSVLKRFGRLPADKALAIARQLCAGLAAAHDVGVVHRDLKPGNVMIDEKGDVRITDFGLAGLMEEFGGGAALEGTPEYMSPEQLAGRELTARSDIYSLGLVLYEIFTGRKAFSASTLTDLLRLRKSESFPESPSSVVKDLDPLVERVIERCLAPDPKDRPATALEVAAALPGGDPLAAALAAGETPSPEMVAAAPKQGSLRPVVAVSLLAATLAALVLALWLSDKALLHRRVPLEKSVQGLKERGAEVARRFDYDAATDSAYGFFVQSEYLKYVREHDKSPNRWDRLKAGRPVALVFWYRQSPRYLLPFNREEITQLDPPRAVAGMASVSLDGSGRMIGFNGTPPQTVETQGAQGFDWSRAFAEAGLDLSSFKPTAPQWTPQQPFDERAAWEGTQPGQPDNPIRVEAAAYQGKLVNFQIVNPWNRPAREEQAAEGPAARVAQASAIVIFFMILLGAALLARHNLRMGRGDRKGALRLAGFVFVAEMIAWLTAAHHVPDVGGEFGLFIESLAYTALLSGMLWLVYIAVEPSVRRRWPGIIIAWNRLLAGDYRDPLVGRDILVGALFGFTTVIVGFLQVLTPQWLGMPARAPAVSLLTGLEGTQYVIALLSKQVVNALITPAALLLLLLIFSIILRRWWAAVGAVFILITLISVLASEHPALDWAFAAANVALILLVLLRFGLLACVFMQFFALVFYFFPMTTDFSAWYAGSTTFTLVAVIALTLYGFRASLAGQRLFTGSLVQD
ncbi:MAG: serine/threonine protein kinase [Acidobacteriota bacterium]|nr:serine/threonine protein kinase [Acidobacteriota bacterium]